MNSKLSIKKIFSINIIFSALLICFVMLPNSSYAEFVFTKDGAITEGTIISETAADVSVKTQNGKVERIPRYKITRILYTQLYMGRVYVQKTDGKGLELFMVDEDQEFYTFRVELYKPDEIKIKRTNVLFIARKNPSGLEAVKVEIDRIEIKWLPPYNQVKSYRVYYKSNPNEKFINAGETSSKDFTIKNLKSNTAYFIIVTAVDRENYESLPSNEIKETTKNIIPYAPEDITVERIPDTVKKTLTLKMKWPAASDPDGTVTGYNLYRKESKKDKLVSTTANLNFEIKNLEQKSKDEFYIRSVDNKKSESKNSSTIYASDRSKFRLGIQFLYLIPLDTYGIEHRQGIGVLVNGEWQNVFFDNFSIGFSTGYWHLFCVPAPTNSIEFSMIVPVLATVSYRIIPVEHLSIIPRIGIGFAFSYEISSGESSRYPGYGLPWVKKTNFSYEVLFLAGVAIQWDITRNVYINAGSDFGVMAVSAPKIFVGISLEAGYRF